MRSTALSLALAGVFVVSALTLVRLPGQPQSATEAQAGGVNAPELVGGGPWFNTDGRPVTIAALRGQVVGVEMWTAGCENCLNVLPHLKQWYAKYHGQGFVLVGVHTPEFSHEAQVEYVRSAIARLGVAYPVVMDNDHRIWNAYHNVYWPSLYLIDKQGRIRYTHIGEGEYELTERQIAELLKEKI